MSQGARLLFRLSPGAGVERCLRERRAGRVLLASVCERNGRDSSPLGFRPGATFRPPVGWASRGEAGWTLAEIMVVTGMIMTLAGIAVPQFSRISTQMRTQAAAARVLNDLTWTRAMSLRTASVHYINVTVGSAIRYDVHRAVDAGALTPGSDPILRSIDLTAGMPDVDFTLNGATTGPYGGVVGGATPGLFAFDSRGLPQGSGTFYVGSEDGSNSYAISITGTGRARLWRQHEGVWQ